MTKRPLPKCTETGPPILALLLSAISAGPLSAARCAKRVAAHARVRRLYTFIGRRPV